MFKRSFSQLSRQSFQRGIVNKAVKAPTTTTAATAAPANSATATSQSAAHGSNGTYKSFAEYRLKVSNQSPLAVRSKTFNANLRTKLAVA